MYLAVLEMAWLYLNWHILSIGLGNAVIWTYLTGFAMVKVPSILKKGIFDTISLVETHI